jgi:DNA-binding MarR family transcriptional regulator
MSKTPRVSFEATLHVRDSCLCLHVQRAARALARSFDEALRPLDLTNGQFSLMMSLNRPEPANMRTLAALLAMDRTTLTAAAKPLERRGLVAVAIDPTDKRNRLMTLTAVGQKLLSRAIPIWSRMHAEVQRRAAGVDVDRLRRDLSNLSTSRADGPAATKRSPRRSSDGARPPAGAGGASRL